MSTVAVGLCLARVLAEDTPEQVVIVLKLLVHVVFVLEGLPNGGTWRIEVGVDLTPMVLIELIAQLAHRLCRLANVLSNRYLWVELIRFSNFKDLLAGCAIVILF